MKNCKYCGSENGNDMKYCTCCGMECDEQPVDTRERTDSKICCMLCGEETYKDSSYCGHCGGKLKNESDTNYQYVIRYRLRDFPKVTRSICPFCGYSGDMGVAGNAHSWFTRNIIPLITCLVCAYFVILWQMMFICQSLFVLFIIMIAVYVFVRHKLSNYEIFCPNCQKTFRKK